MQFFGKLRFPFNVLLKIDVDVKAASLSIAAFT